MSASLLNQPLLVLANVPDQALAERLSNTLVEQGLAACVNILSPVQSVYRWQGKVQRDLETVVRRLFHPGPLPGTAAGHCPRPSLRRARDHRLAHHGGSAGLSGVDAG